MSHYILSCTCASIYITFDCELTEGKWSLRPFGGSAESRGALHHIAARFRFEIELG